LATGSCGSAPNAVSPSATSLARSLYALISRIEAGARTPSVKTIRMLAAKLGMSEHYLEARVASPVEQEEAVREGARERCA
jgi:transcriptional regulator with XRE-family HTH domain